MQIKVNKSIVLFLTGYCAYTALEVSFRGISYPLMGICGGLALLILDKLNDEFSWDFDLLLQGIIGALLITGFEFVIGEIYLHTNLIPQMWNYSNVILNYRGIVCVPFSLLWVLLSIVAIMIADAINYYVYSTTTFAPYYKIFGKVVFYYKRKDDTQDEGI